MRARGRDIKRRRDVRGHLLAVQIRLLTAPFVFQAQFKLFSEDFSDGLSYEGISFSLKFKNVFLMATCHSTFWLCILYLTTSSLLTI